MTKEQMVEEFKYTMNILGEKCRGIDSCVKCKYREDNRCRTALLAEAMYDAGYRKLAKNDDATDAVEYALNHPVIMPWRHKKRFLLVEDGSVDLDDIEDYLEDLDIRLIVYRQGSQKPELVEIEE